MLLAEFKYIKVLKNTHPDSGWYAYCYLIKPFFRKFVLYIYSNHFNIFKISIYKNLTTPEGSVQLVGRQYSPSTALS